MGIFISVPKTIECILVALVFTALIACASYRLLGILQSAGYKSCKFLGWLKKKGNPAFARHSLLAVLSAVATAVVCVCFAFAGEWAAVIGSIVYIPLYLAYMWGDNRVALRTPLTKTPRLKRLAVTLFVIQFILIYLAVTLLNFADAVWKNSIFTYLRYVPLSAFAFLLAPLVALANAVNKIYEVPHNRGFIKKAKAKLEKSRIKVVGITGSYGKTSTKKILSDILSTKYRVLSTPRSHNTPIGIALAVNGAKLEDYDIFIAEMGARHLGDISELCEICPPDYSVITGICPQHLESFGSVENIVKAKGEILSYTKQKCIIADDCYSLFAAYSAPNECERCVSEIEADCTGTQFTLTLGGESKRVKTKLLGAHSAKNIGLAAQLAHEIGMTLNEICTAIEGLDYIEHRLQLIESGGINILDDGYNCNVKGAAAAIEVLKSFKGRKVAVTPGIVELGVLEKSENRELGKRLAGLDYVILVGETLVTPVKEGYILAGGDLAKLTVKPTLAAAQEEIKGLSEGDTVLFLNDLPDVY